MSRPTAARASSISPTPRKCYTVALGEPIMKPRMSMSPPPPSMIARFAPAGDDDAGDEDEDAGTEEDALYRTIGRVVGRAAAVAGSNTQQKHRRDTSRLRGGLRHTS
ncbi:hypothetical protein EI94DRAFT_537238 [Lactarius quietus]|nr:hypothetical protein EI94DRAFT_537238 [Lactarius quietus]